MAKGKGMTGVTEQSTAVEKREKKKLTHSERFTAMVMREFSSAAGALEVNEFQKRLIQGYFIAVDNTLKAAELKRQGKSEKYKDKVPVTWENVNMTDLALDVVANARLGLDASIKNHIHPIPFKNNNTGKYDVVFIKGYEGLEYVAKRYALEIPEEVITEIVYSTDTFKPVKRGGAAEYESYEFAINQPFDRGDIVGGFAYFSYENQKKNRLMIMKLQDIEKRKPKYASPEFWGGKRDKWDKGKKTTEEVEGWYEEMVLKTIKRAAYSSLPLDPKKIDDNYLVFKEREQQWDKKMLEAQAEEEVEHDANSETIDIDSENDTEDVVDAEYEDVTDKEPADPGGEVDYSGTPFEDNGDTGSDAKQPTIKDGPDY
jgi:recombination protein RecT